MKKLLHKLVYFSILIGLVFLSCKKEINIADNIPPVANAGQDQTTILPKDSVVLDATASKDPDGYIITYRWTKIYGPSSFTIMNDAAPTTIVRSLVQGIYHFELNVTDKEGANTKDTVQITVTTGNGSDQPPVANAGADQTIVLPVSLCTLNGGTSYDPDGFIEKYQWTKISGPSSYIFQDSTATYTIVNQLGEGYYSFELTVTDNSGLIAKDTVHIAVIYFVSAECDIINRQKIYASLIQIGTLSEPRIPYAAAAGSKIVFAGGGVINGPYYIVSSAVDIYDVNTKTWSTATLSQANVGIPESKGKEGIAVISCANKIFFAGGGFFDLAYTTIDIFDISTNSWTLAHLSEGRSYLTAAALGNKVFFAGGFTNQGPNSKRVDIYDLATNTWSIAELSKPRCFLTSVSVGDKIYFAGGYDESNSASVDIYNSTTNSWSTAELKELAGPVSAVAVGDKIYWAGVGGGNKGEVEIWNTTTGDISFSCLSYPRYAPAAIVKNDEIIFLSSSSEWNNEVDLIHNLTPFFDIYNILTNQWSIGVLPQPVIAPGIVNVNNSLYMGGGRSGKYSCTDKVYMLNW